MRAVIRRAADPPFPRVVRLLGVNRRLHADVRLPYRQRRVMLSVIRRAAAKLESDAPLLSASDRRRLSAVKRFALGAGRSGQDRGTFIFGWKDVQASQDAAYWASALVHDGAHALMQGRGGRYFDEVGPCNAQIAYLKRTHADEALIRHVEAFRDSRARQRSRWRQDV